MDRILKEERQYLLELSKKIKKAGCNVLLIQKSILRDAVNEMSLHFLAKLKIMVIKDIERDEVEFICKVRAGMGGWCALRYVLTLPTSRRRWPPRTAGKRRRWDASPLPISRASMNPAWPPQIWLRRRAKTGSRPSRSQASRAAAAPHRCCAQAPTNWCWKSLSDPCTMPSVSSAASSRSGTACCRVPLHHKVHPPPPRGSSALALGLRTQRTWKH